MIPKKKFSVIHVPADSVNPYNQLLGVATELFGVKPTIWVDAPNRSNPRALLLRLRDTDLVHWHWYQRFYQARTRPRFIARSALFLTVLIELRLRKIPQVVTVHNLLPHEFKFAGLHRRMCRLTGALVDRLIVHHEDAVEPVAALYGARDKIRIVPHMDYERPAIVSARADLRKKWGLTAFSRWAVVFGGVRRYKCVDLVVRVSEMLSQNDIGVIVAGPCPDEFYRAELECGDREDTPVFILRHLESDELSEILFASDVAVLPYAESLTSGAAHLALAHGLPLVATNALAFREMVRLGIANACDPENKTDLVATIESTMSMKNEDWVTKVRDYRKCRSLTVVGRCMVEVYAELLPGLSADGQEGLEADMKAKGKLRK